MAKITFEIYDTEDQGGNGVRVVVTPSVQELIVKAHKSNISSGEALAMHLARKALEYSKAQEAKASKIIIPKLEPGITTI